MEDRCHIRFGNKDFKDITGCLKPDGHDGHHVCQTEDGMLMAWGDDYSCQCGCWDEWEDSSGREGVCMIYWVVENINQ